MTASAGFFQSPVREGTKIKLSMLGWYLSPWVDILMSYAATRDKDRIWFVDPFAGEGRIESNAGSPGEDGSPVIASRKSFQMIRAGKTIRLGVYAIEKQKKQCDRLIQTLAPFKRDGVPVVVKQGDWVTHLDNVLKVTSDCPVLLFMDPFGLKGIETAKLFPLLRRQATDVIFRIHDSSITRNAELYPDMITSALATDKWKDGWEYTSDGGGAKRVEIAITAFRKVITDEMGPNARAFRYAVTSGRRKNPFSLVFCSRNDTAKKLWAENAAKQDRERLREQSAGKFPGTEELLFRKRHDEIKDLVFKDLLTRRESRGDAIYMRVIESKFVKEAEVHKALVDLIEVRCISRTPPHGAWKRALFSPSTGQVSGVPA